MIKFILVLLAVFGMFTFLGIFVPGVWSAAFTVRGVAVPWIFIGSVLVGYVSWKKIS